MLSEVTMLDFDGPLIKCVSCNVMLGRTRRRYCRKCSDDGNRDKTTDGDYGHE
jgi:hypothetical protein